MSPEAGDSAAPTNAGSSGGADDSEGGAIARQRGPGHPGAVSFAVRRSADVLAALTDLPDIGITELSRRYGWPKSVTHRTIATLADAGLVSIDPLSHRYRLGPAALRLGFAALARADVHRLAGPHLHALRDRTGETATLSLLSGDTRLYVDQVESNHPVRQSIKIGSHAPLYLGGSSKVILAFLSASQQALVLAAAVGATYADGSPVDAKGLNADLDTIRSVGYAISRGERIAGATSVAAPIMDGRGEVIGSMSVAGVTVRQDRTALERLGPIVRDEALALSVELGWTPPGG